MSKKNFLFLSFLLPFFSQAQDSTNVLSEVVITANKYPKKQTETGKVITVLDARTLQQMGSRTLPEIINTVAGVTINGANNNPGTNQGVSIRGASFGNVLILVDGIPVNDPSVISNYYDLNFIPVQQVERIEILKGGQSTLYGSDAVAGVINIITKKAAAKPLQLNAQLQAGSYNTYEATAGLSGNKGIVSFQLQETYQRSKGFSTAFDSTDSKNFDNDQYNQNVLCGSLRLALSKAVAVTLFSNYSRYKAGIDASAFVDDKDYTTENKNYQGGAGLTWQLPKGNLVANYHFNWIERGYQNDSTDRSDPFSYYSASNYIGRTHFAEVYKSFAWQGFELLTGVDYRYNNSTQTSSYVYIDFFSGLPVFGQSTLDDSIAHAWQLSPYASVVYKHKGIAVELGGRFNHHSQYGNNSTYTFNPSYLIYQKVKLFANASSAFKAPSLYQLYDAYAGNKNLNPETSTTLEGGAEWYATSSLKWRVTGFHRNTKNAIQYVIIDPATYASAYRNVNRQKASGIETEITLRNKKWNLMANYTFTKANATSNFTESGSNLGKDTTINYLYRVPKHAINAVAFYQLTKKFELGTVVRYVGKRLEPVYAAAPKTLDDYYTIDLSAQYNVAKNFRLFADFKNITNQRYFDISGYNSRRFNMAAGLSLTL